MYPHETLVAGALMGAGFTWTLIRTPSSSSDEVALMRLNVWSSSVSVTKEHLNGIYLS